MKSSYPVQGCSTFKWLDCNIHSEVAEVFICIPAVLTAIVLLLEQGPQTKLFFLLFPLFNGALPLGENPSATIFVWFPYII